MREADETAIRDSREVDQRTPQAVHFQLHQDGSGSNTKVPKTSRWGEIHWSPRQHRKATERGPGAAYSTFPLPPLHPPNYKGQQPSPLWSTGAHRILGTRQCCQETIPLRGRRAWLPSPPPEPPPQPRDGDFSAASHFPTRTQDSLCSCTVRLTPLILSYMGGYAQCLIFPLPDDLEIQNLCVCQRRAVFYHVNIWLPEKRWQLGVEVR